MNQSKPELLMPAGNIEKLITAFRYGADACYLGMPDFSLRYRENQIREKDIKKAIIYAHKLNKKIYVTINTYPHNENLKNVIKHIKFLARVKPDAIIFSDPGVYNLIKKYYPEATLHLSVQATATNFETVRFWQKQGVKKVILARELSLTEIAQIHKQVPKIELECFVHGAICMAYSGRCLLSNYLTGRDANQGDCAHTCRWNYKIKKQCHSEYGEESQYHLEEQLRPHEYFPIYENDHGSHILSSRDLCLIEHLDKIASSGVISFKIEGRAKNTSYIATIARAYRQAIDDFMARKKFDKKLLREVSAVSNRGFFTGFYFDKPNVADQQLDGNRTEGTYDFIGVVKKYNKKTKLATVEIKGQIKIGDNLEILTPKDIYKIKINELFTNNYKLITIYHPGLSKPVLIKIAKPINPGDIIRKKIE